MRTLRNKQNKLAFIAFIAFIAKGHRQAAIDISPSMCYLNIKPKDILVKV